MKVPRSSLKAIAGKRYWREDDAERVVTAWSASGQSQVEFARRHDIHVGRLRRWIQRLSREDAPTFHPVELVLSEPSAAPDTTGLELLLRDGYRIAIRPGFDRALLKQLVQTIESWSC
jgi:hypothetical protein